MENILDLFKEFLKINPKAHLSGSASLNFQGVKTRRVPVDIDIYLPTAFYKTPEGWEKVKCLEEDLEEDYESQSAFDRISFNAEGVKVDLFIPNPSAKKLEECIFNAVPVIWKTDILSFKMEHAMGNASTRYKHIEDLIFILNNLD